MAYSLLDSSIAKPPGDQLTPVYMFVSGCLAAAFAKVTYFLVTCVHKSCRHWGSFCLSTNFHTSAAFLICHWIIRTHKKWLSQVWKHLGSGQLSIREHKQWGWWRQREQQKSDRFSLAKQQLCTSTMLFYSFLCNHCTTTTWKCLICDLWRTWTEDNDLPFLFLNFDRVLWSEKFTNIWRNELDIRSMVKFEAAWTHFLSDIFIAIVVA